MGPSVTRSFSAASVTPGGELVVTVTVSNYGSGGQVVEMVPAGFAYVSSTLSGSSVGVDGQTVRFTLLGETSFSYTVTVSSTEGSYSFAGTLTDFYRVEHQTAGDTEIEVATPAPTPTMPAPTPTKSRPSSGGGGGGGGPVVGLPVQTTPTPVPTLVPTAEPTGPVPTPVLGQRPSQPHVFTGDVMVGEGLAMEGTEVSAMIDGETVAMAMVMADGRYSLKIDSGDADYSGKMIMFMIGMENVEQSAEWMEGMVSSLNLMVMEPEPTEPPAGMPGPTGPSGLQGPVGADGADGADGARRPGKAGKVHKAQAELTATRARTATTAGTATDGNGTALTATTVLTAPLEPRATRVMWATWVTWATRVLRVQQAAQAAVSESWASSP